MPPVARMTASGFMAWMLSAVASVPSSTFTPVSFSCRLNQLHEAGEVFQLEPLDEPGQRHQPAEARVLLDEGDVVAAQGRRPRGLHAGGTAADDHDLLLVGGLLQILVAIAESGVGAALAQEGLALVEAGAATGAGPHVLSLAGGQLVGQVGVADEGPVHADEIGLALLQQLSRRVPASCSR